MFLITLLYIYIYKDYKLPKTLVVRCSCLLFILFFCNLISRMYVGSLGCVFDYWIFARIDQSWFTLNCSITMYSRLDYFRFKSHALVFVSFSFYLLYFVLCIKKRITNYKHTHNLCCINTRHSNWFYKLWSWCYSTLDKKKKRGIEENLFKEAKKERSNCNLWILRTERKRQRKSIGGGKLKSEVYDFLCFGI